MIQLKTKIQNIFETFCDQNGGGKREINIAPGRFGGFTATLVWDGFESMGLGDRHSKVFKLLIPEMGADVFQIVRSIHLITFAEKYEEEAIETAIPR